MTKGVHVPLFEFIIHFTVCGVLLTKTQQSCAANAVSAKFQALDSACYANDSSSTDGWSSQLPADSQLSCALLCALRSSCKYFEFSLKRCSMSARALGMTHRKMDPRFSRCQEVCINSRRFCIVQQRLTDTVNFSRNWSDYENGFGDADNFWIGLRLLSLITAQSGSLILRAEMRDWNNSVYVAEHRGFVVQNASTNYTMNFTQIVSASSNVTSDSLSGNKGMMFSTLDRDNDRYSASCSTYWHGGAGWWFSACSDVNPNGVMTAAEVANYPKGIIWVSVHGNKNSLKAIRLLVQMSN